MKLALIEAEMKEVYLKQQLHGQQVAIVLQLMYCEHVRWQLATKEAKEAAGGGKGKLMGDGKAKLLSGDAFVALVIEHEEATRKGAEEKEARKTAREMHSQVMSKWKAAEEERQKRNRECTEWFKEAVEDWEIERDEQKLQKPCWAKPKREALEGPIPKPKKVQVQEEEEEISDEESAGSDTSVQGIVVEDEGDKDVFLA